MISEYLMSQTADILPKALVQCVDPNELVQKQVRKLNVEWIVWGYLWDSLAASYERGDRTFCGSNLPNGLYRFQKLDVPLFKPTTKAAVGHEENTMPSDLVGGAPRKRGGRAAKQAALALFDGESEIMRARGLILVDTKYESGLDRDCVLHVSYEVNSPDSSHLCDAEEREENHSRVATAIATRRYNTMTALLDVQPELKIKEFSPQYIRDVLLDTGFNPAHGTEGPKLSEDTEIVEYALFGMKDLRPPLLPQPLDLEPGPLGSASPSQSDTSERSLCREPARYSCDNSVAPGSSDDGVPVAPSRFLKMHDGVPPSLHPEGWLVRKPDRGVPDNRQPWCVGSVAPIKGCNSTCVPSSRPSSFAGEQWFV